MEQEKIPWHPAFIQAIQYGYACLYASLEKFSITNLTITFVESRYPRELLNHLSEVLKYKVEEKPSGIYTLTGDKLSMQIIDCRMLSAREALKMSNAAVTLDEVLEEAGLIAKWEARAEERNTLKIAQNMLNLGYSTEAIVSATELDPEKVKALLRKTENK